MGIENGLYSSLAQLLERAGPAVRRLRRGASRGNVDNSCRVVGLDIDGRRIVDERREWI